MTVALGPRRAVLGMVLAASLLGCATLEPPEPAGTPQACEGALLGPVTLLLGADGQSTVGMPEDAVPVPLRWPDGYGLRPAPNGGDVVNEWGESIARIGERVWLGGGFGADDGEFRVCGDVMREDPAR